MPRKSALELTGLDLASAMRSATFGDLPPVKWVIDEDADEPVGWVRDLGKGKFPIEWFCRSRGGWEATEEKALARISDVLLEDRERARQAA